jgi:DNA-binding IclR family transcriptional regulator
VAAVSVGGPSQRLPAARLRELAPLVVKAAAAISEGLGYRP